MTIGGSCVTPPGWGSLNKWPVGVAANGNVMVYRIDYSFFNTTNCIVTDTIPACETILSAAVQPYDGSNASIVGQTVTWRVQDGASTPRPDINDRA